MRLIAAACTLAAYKEQSAQQPFWAADCWVPRLKLSKLRVTAWAKCTAPDSHTIRRMPAWGKAADGLQPAQGDCGPDCVGELSSLGACNSTMVLTCCGKVRFQ